MSERRKPSPGMPWVHVVVYQPPNYTGPVIVNVYGYHSENAARYAVTKLRKETLPEGGVLLANRCRPVLEVDRDGVVYE